MPLFIQTKRLTIIPLSYDELVDYLKNYELASEGEVRYFEGEVLTKLLEAQNDDYLFYTLWVGIDKERGCVVTEMVFRGIPDENGQIELGYMTFHGERSKGYMQESVYGMVEWARQSGLVNSILLKIEPENVASVKVAEINGFTKDKNNYFLYL